ncbi:hypothetical protein [Neptuniibacter sp. CAU 1671]|uniref:hypothetical protein n=1 Tax=Neptuniibacter sp. CAU 1671 TaxID=3032593 RepID=UPI0023DC3755|nr:hypothetical protein [Neptuniibacter sp. CAU 1671]MDF2181238.1 hypothetical protein [Neptuniibacter sp. CAU 1671]
MKLKTTFSLSLAGWLLSSAVLAAPLTVEKAWESEAQLLQPESVVYDILRRSLYVSNVNGEPGEADGNGFVSLLDEAGTISKLHWVDGLNAPKGMAMFGKKLFVADLDTLVVIDVEKAEILQRFKTEQSSFLNDIGINEEGIVYVTDTMNNRIYRLYRGKFEIWLEDPRLENPNGIYVGNHHIFIASWGVPTEGWSTKVPGHLLQVSLQDKTVEDFASEKPIGNLDGVAKIDENNLLVTDWMSGKLLQLSREGEQSTLAELGQGAADLLYLRSKKMMLIPQMMEGRLVALKVK